MSYGANIVFRMRWMAGLALGLLALIIPVAFAGSGAELPAGGSAPAAAPVTPSLMAARTPAKRVEVIVQLAPGTRRAAAGPLVRELGGKVTGDLHIINGVAAK